MKRWLWLVLLFIPHCVFAQTKTTVTASIQDASGNPATSGYVEFRIAPSSSAIGYRVTGTTVIAPQTSRCTIAAGALSGCTVWGNTTLQPASTCYDVVVAPNNQVRTTTRQLISGSGYDLSTPTFCTPVNVVPQYQTITTAPISANLVPAANKVFNLGDSGHYYGQAYVDNAFINSLTVGSISGVTFNLPVSANFKNLNNVRKCDQFPGANAGAKIAACITDLPSGGGTADARGLEGPQTGGVDVLAGVTKPVTLLLGDMTLTTSVGWSVPDSLRLLGQCGGTSIIYTGTGSFMDTGATGTPANVEIGCLAFTSGVGQKGFLQVGSTTQDFANGLLRLRWHLHDLYLVGPGAGGTGQVGISATEYLDWTVDHVTILNFERPAIWDRGGNSHFDRVRFQAFEFGAWWTIKGGTGAAADGSNQDVCTSCEFLGPTWGTGDTVTIQHQNITFINALYECQAGGTSTNLLDLTSRGATNGDSAYFTDIGGLFSFTGACGGLLHTINFSSGFAGARFIGTDIPIAGFPPIQFGTIYNGGSDDYTVKFINTSYALNVLVAAADATGAKATIFQGGNSTAIPGHVLTQTQINDQTGMLRILDRAGYTQIVSGSGKGLEFFYQDSGDQALINSIDRTSGGAVFKPIVIQPSSLSVTPAGTNAMLSVNTSGSVFRGSITGSTVSPAIGYASASTGSVGASGTASVTLNWDHTWADTGMFPLCSVIESTNAVTLALSKIIGVSTTQITVVVVNNDTMTARTGQVDCVGFHP